MANFTELTVKDMTETNGGSIPLLFSYYLHQDTRPIVQVIRNGKFMITQDYNPSTDQIIPFGSVVSAFTK